MGMYQSLIRPMLFRWTPETAHDIAMTGMRLGLGNPAGRAISRMLYGFHDPRLEQTLWGRPFRNPVGLAAGLDKEAQVIDGMATFGFSHVEVGTITGQAQPGNEKPRLFRLPPDKAVINRMGFNNSGSEVIGRRLGRRYHPAGGSRRPRCQLGINIGKTKVVELDQALDDYRSSVERLAPLADYLVVNVSSPNTPGLRDLQAEASLRPLLAGVREALDGVAAGVPLLLKIAPDLAAAGIDAAVDVALECRCDGIIATNTTIGRQGLTTPESRIQEIGAGGLSGAPLRQLSTQVLAQVARRVDGRVPVIGVGGIDSAASAWEKICHGASLVQVYSAFIYEGPGLVSAINRGLVAHLQQAELSSISEAVGRDL